MSTIYKLTTRYGVDGLPKLAKEGRVQYEGNGFRNSDVLNDFLCKKLHSDTLTEEHVWVIFCNNKLLPVGLREISIGTINQSVVDVRNIFMTLLLSGCNNLFLVHNHPSGSVEPSNEDIELTKKISSCADFLNVRFLDHIIVGKGSFYSFKDHAIL